MLTRIARSGLALLACVLVTGCAADATSLGGSRGKKTASNGEPGSASDGREGPEGPGAGDETTEPEAIPKTQFTFGACTGNYAEATTCGTAEVPLDWSVPTGKKIKVFVAGLGDGRAKTRLFMVQGGPGGSADGILFLAKMLREKRPDVDVMVIEHRGVGRSTRLACTTATDAGNVLGEEAGACADEMKRTWGEGLAHFNTSNAARDLASVIQTLRPAGTKAFVYGVSYGTYLVHRLLQIAPYAVDGAVLDSAVPPEGQTFDQFDAQGDPVLRRLADVCKRSRQCVANLGADPFAAMSRIIGGFDGSRCASALGFDRTGLRGTLFGMLQSSEVSALVPSFLVRLARCNARDEQAVRKLFTVIAPDATAQKGTPEGDLGSGVVYNNIVFSELWSNPPPNEATLRSRLDALTLTTGGVELANGAVLPQILDMEKRRTVWPTYARDRYVGKWAAPTVPVLTLNGDFDVQTPIETARQFETKLAGAGKTFAFVPFANHGVLFQSLTRSGEPCGLRIVTSFLDTPEAPDAACTKDVLPPDVDVSSDIARIAYGTTTGYAASVNGAAVVAPRAFASDDDDVQLESPRARRFKDHLDRILRFRGGAQRRPTLR